MKIIEFLPIYFLDDGIVVKLQYFFIYALFNNKAPIKQ
jgi:hypothetical protein